MSVNPLRFVGGMAIEVGALVLVVTLLPKIQLGPSVETGPGQIADERPSLAMPREEAMAPDWRTAVRRQELPSKLPAPDPAYVERRLDHAGEKLLSGMHAYLSHAAQDLLDSDAVRPAPLDRPSFSPPNNRLRY